MVSEKPHGLVPMSSSKQDESESGFSSGLVTMNPLPLIMPLNNGNGDR